MADHSAPLRRLQQFGRNAEQVTDDALDVGQAHQADGVAGQAAEGFADQVEIDLALRALAAGGSDLVAGPLADDLALELRERQQDVQREPADVYSRDGDVQLFGMLTLMNIAANNDVNKVIVGVFGGLGSVKVIGPIVLDEQPFNVVTTILL